MPLLRRFVLSDMRMAKTKPRLLKPHILILDRIVVDAAIRRGNPCCHPAWLVHAVHQAEDEGLVAFGRQPFGLARRELLGTDRVACCVRRDARPVTDIAAEACTRQRQTEWIAGLLDQAVPALHAQVAVADVRTP